jgi:transposase InsO family protein
VETQFSAKIKKLKTDNGGEYVNKEMTAFLEIKCIIHDLSPPYAYESNGRPERMNRTIVMIVRLMTLDWAYIIPRALWAEMCSTAVHIKNRLLHSTFKLEKWPYVIIFGDKLSIQPLYPFGAKCYMHVYEEK